jgi:hypothetical protein
MQQHENNETTCVKPKPVATQCLYVKQLLHDELLALYHHATAAGSQRPPELCGVWRMIAAVMGFWRYSITPYNWLYYCLMAQQGSKPKAASRLQTHCTQHNQQCLLFRSLQHGSQLPFCLGALLPYNLTCTGCLQWSSLVGAALWAWLLLALHSLCCRWC